MKWRRITGGLVAAGMLASLGPGSSGVLLAAQGGALLQGLLRDPLEILADRSPGARGSGALVQSKPHQGWQPSERVLSPVRDRNPGAIPVDLDNLAGRAAEVIAPTVPLAAGTPAAGMPGPALPPAAWAGLPGAAIPPAPGGGGGAVLPPAPPPPPVAAPVPEPATWILMIAGIGLIGLQLRRRHAAGPRTT